MEKLKTKVAFISDTHGNSAGLEAVLQDIEQYEVDELIVLGDMFIGVDPHGVIALLRDWTAEHKVHFTGIQGNAESYLLTPHREHLREYGLDWAEPVANIIDWCEPRLTAEELAWIRSWPLISRWQNACLVHDSPLDRIQVETASNPLLRPEHREWFFHGPGIAHDLSAEAQEPFFAYMEENDYDYLFCGHSHRPFVYQKAGKVICSAGSAGASLDGNWRPAWVLLDTGLCGAESLSIHRVEYDLTKIYRLIDENPDYPSLTERPGMAQAFKKWYTTGYYWAFFIPGMLPDVDLGFDVEDIE